MGFLLLGVDSLIACLAIGAIVNRKWRVPFAVCFGIADGGGFLLGTALHWSVPDGVANVVETTVLLALGVYWIAVAVLSRRASDPGSSNRWVWILPWVLSIDNITYGLIDHAWSHSVAVQALEQAVSSALLAGIGLAVSVYATRAIPAVQRSRIAATGFAGCALILAAGVELLVG
jgi:uncharacterized membrane protein YhaH (DUF805 family)